MSEVIQGFARLAFSDLREVLIWDEHGNVQVRASDAMADGAAYAISEIIQTIGPGHITLRIKLTDKKAALDSLARYLKLFTDKVDLTAQVHHTHDLAALFMAMEEEEAEERKHLLPWVPPPLELEQGTDGVWQDLDTDGDLDPDEAEDDEED